MTSYEINNRLMRIDAVKNDYEAAYVKETDLYSDFITHIAELGSEHPELSKMAEQVLTAKEIIYS